MHLYPPPIPSKITPHFSLLCFFHSVFLCFCKTSSVKMENKFKLKLSNMFRSSFGSCRTRNLTDVIDKAVFLPDPVEPPPTKPVAAVPRPFPSICRPKCSDPNQKFINESCVISSKDALIPRRKIFERRSPFAKPFDPDGGHTSPFSPLDPFYDSSKQRKNRATKNKRKTTKKKNPKTTDFFKFSSSSFDSNKYRGWWSSSDDDGDEREDETDTLFSSKSHSSDSSGPRLRRRSRRNGSSASRRRAASSDVGLIPLQGRVKDSFAVVKKSSDPYNDFRTSMVEMIFEKQIFSAKDLEHLLQCFLKLNSAHHHRIIIEVFTEIWEALFSNWGS